MALTSADKDRVLRMLDELDELDVQKVIRSLGAFEKWFYVTLPEIYRKIKEQIGKVWSWLCSVFS